MAEKKFYVDINLNGQQLKNFALEMLAADPTGGSAFEARMYYNTTDKVIRYHNGTEWKTIGDQSGYVHTVEAHPDSTAYLTITEVDGVVQIKLNTVDASTIEHQDLTGAGTNDHAAIDAHIASTSNPHGVTLEQARTENNRVAGNIEMGDGSTNNQIKNLANGTDAQDAVTLAQLQAAQAGLSIKTKVQLVAVTALPTNGAAGTQEGKTLTGLANGALVIDDVPVQVDWRILVNGEANQINNGIYRVTATGDAGSSYILTRDSAFDDSPSAELSGGDYFFVEFGANYKGSGWVLRSVGSNFDTDPVVDTDILVFEQFHGLGDYLPGAGISITGKTIAFVANDAAGKGLVEGDNASELQVENYEPQNDTEISVSKRIPGVALSVGANANIAHNMQGYVKVFVFDEADGSEVEVVVAQNGANMVDITTNIAFTATLLIVRIAYIPV